MGGGINAGIASHSIELISRELKWNSCGHQVMANCKKSQDR